MVSTIKQLVNDKLLCFITLKKTVEVTFPRAVTKTYHSQTYFNNILGINLNEKLNFYRNILVRNDQKN